MKEKLIICCSYAEAEQKVNEFLKKGWKVKHQSMAGAGGDTRSGFYYMFTLTKSK